MKINNINNFNQKRLVKRSSDNKQNNNNAVLKANINNNNKINSTPAFKGLGGIDGFCLGLADLIENGGLFVSFTLQDMLGTNLPRPIMGLMRNSKENEGKTNTKFAAKELVREMLTGPSMFIIPMGMLAAGQKLFGKSIEIPMKVIQDFGRIHANAPVNEAKEAISSKEFFANTFEEMIKNAKGEETISKDTIKTANAWAKDLSNAISTATDKQGKKALESKISELSDNFTAIAKSAANNPIYKDFTNVTLGKSSGSFKDTTKFMISYADDAIGKAQEYISKNGVEKVAEFIKNKADINTVKRFGTNAAMFAGVLAFLQIIPKLYNKAEGEGNAGLTGLMKEETLKSNTPAKNETKTDNKQTTQNTNNSQQPSFKGGLATTFADKATTGKLGKLLNGTEFQGYNLSLPLLLGIMGLGVLLPRVVQSKDKYDREEIVRRDLVTCATMAFGEKILCKLFSKANEASSGLVLTQKAPDFDQRKTLSKIWDYIRPEKGVGILSSDKIVAKYSNIEQYKNGVAGFAQSISNEGGNLSKLFSIDDKAKEIIEKLIGEGKTLANADNDTIINALKQAKGTDAEKGLVELFKQKEGLIEKFDFKGLLKGKFGKKQVQGIIDNPWVKKAKTLNSRFTALSVLVLVPVFLGFMLPAINERATKKRIKEEQAAGALKPNTTTNQNFQPKTPSVFDEINPFVKK